MPAFLYTFFNFHLPLLKYSQYATDPAKVAATIAQRTP
jgi:hypothetical protein